MWQRCQLWRNTRWVPIQTYRSNMQRAAETSVLMHWAWRRRKRRSTGKGAFFELDYVTSKWVLNVKYKMMTSYKSNTKVLINKMFDFYHEKYTWEYGQSNCSQLLCLLLIWRLFRCCCIAFDCWVYISGYMAFGYMGGREIQITTSSYISPLTPFSGAAGTSRAAHMIAFDCLGLIALWEVRPFQLLECQMW